MKAARNIFVVCLILLSLALTAIAQDPPQADANASVSQPMAVPLSDREDDRYRIGFQDKLQIQVFGHPKLAQVVSVNPNGTINLFRLPEPIIAVCKTERELSQDIAAAYQKDYLRDPEVQVAAIEQRSQAFAVIGAVEKPGSYFINRRVRLLELLAQAGGPSKEAGGRVLVARTGSNSDCKMNTNGGNRAEDEIVLLDFKLDDVLQAKQDLVMRPGDIVSVMDADVIYVYGNVNKQGQVPIKEPITLTQALASAEGLRPATEKDKVRVLRQKPGSADREEFVYSLKEIDKGTVRDPYLEANDIVAVSEDRAKSILNGIARSLTSGVSTLFYRVP